jgi:tetratricopeptide (TPR) repeat protein
MVELRPDDAQAYVKLGEALMGMEREDAMKEAEDAFREAIRLKPDAPGPHFLLARALDWRGVEDEAIPEYREAIRLGPDNSRWARGHLIGVLNFARNPRLRDPAEALDQARKLIKITHGIDSDSYYALAVAEYRLGHWDEALAALEKCKSLGRWENGYYWFLEALIHAKRGDKDQSRPDYDKALAWSKATRNEDRNLHVLWAEADKLLGPPGPDARLPGDGPPRPPIAETAPK